jgi:hypothetical protein
MEFLLARMFRSFWVSVTALVVVVLSLVLPPGGPPMPLCQFKVMTGLPCLGWATVFYSSSDTCRIPGNVK